MMYKKMTLLLIFTLFLVNCSTNNFKIESVGDCPKIKNSFKKDECYADLAAKISLDDLEKGLAICNYIEDSMLKDACYLHIFEQKFGLISTEQLYSICEKIENNELEDSCRRKVGRPHLRGYVK